MNLIISDEVKEKIDKRGITEDDIKAVITNSGKDKTFLIDEENNHILAKHRMGNFCPYVKYTKDGDNHTIITSYAHTIELGYEFEK